MNSKRMLVRMLASMFAVVLPVIAMDNGGAVVKGGVGVQHARASENEEKHVADLLSQELLKAAETGDVAFIERALKDKSFTIEATSETGGTLLGRAATYGQTGVMQLLLHNKARVDACNNHGFTPLMAVVGKGHADAMHMLLAHGANVNAQNKEGTSVVSWAIVGGHNGLVPTLLASKADITVQNNGGGGPLYIASHRGRVEAVDILLAAKAAVNECKKGGQTPLAAAAYAGHDEVVTRLLAANALIDAQDNAGATPLTWAARAGRVSAAALLLAAKAQIDIKRQGGKDALRIAVDEQHGDVVKLLLDGKANIEGCDDTGRTPLLAAVLEAQPAMAELLLAKNANVMATYANNITPLMLVGVQSAKEKIEAALRIKKVDLDALDADQKALLIEGERKKQREVVRLLIANKASVTATLEGNDFTALFGASDAGDEAIVGMLIEGRSDVNKKGKSVKSTALIAAAAGGHTAVLKKLLDNKAKVGFADMNGKTALMHCCEVGNAPAVDMLLARKAAVNQEDKGGITPLKWAIASNHTEIALRLLDAGADAEGHSEVNIFSLSRKNPNKVSPLMFAALRGNEVCARALIAKGANINACTEEGITPLVSAILQDHTSLVKFLIDNNAHTDGDTFLLYNACTYAGLETVKVLVERGVNAFAVICPEDGKVAIQKAFDRGNNDIITLLAFFGADAGVLKVNIDEATAALDNEQEPVEYKPKASAALSSINDLLASIQARYDVRATWSAEKLEKLKKDIEDVQAIHATLGQQNWLPEVLLESHLLSDYVPEALESCVDEYATQYASNNHDTLLDTLVKEHIQRVQWLQLRGVDCAQADSYESGAVVRLVLAEKKKIEQGEEKENDSEVVVHAQEYLQRPALGLVARASRAYDSLKGLLKKD